MNDNFNYSLKEIADWTLGESEITIPAIQRGLVWKPKQVELLWDSILRGFPIGSFLLSDIEEKDNKKGKYYLMDGQQRFNAISLGFKSDQYQRAVLWIDINPSETEKTTRKFWIKATTIPHPWGFKNDDDCSRLNTEEKRNALEMFELEGNIYNKEFSLLSTWPIKAKCPIPLSCLLDSINNGNTKDPESFLHNALELFKKSDFKYREKIMLDDKAKEYVGKKLFPAFTALKKYRVHCNHLPKDVLTSETLEETDEKTSLEVLFTRQNTGGTQISRDDLNYSAIKAYWPSIKDKNDFLAQNYMSPSKLAMLAFRLAQTNDEDNKLKGEFSINQIRNFAKDEEIKEKIEKLYNTQRLENVLCTVDEWLGVDVSENSDMKTPNLIRTLISHNSPDVYLLLMYLANKKIDSQIELQPSEIKALAFCIHWFANDKAKCVQTFFSYLKEGINIQNLRKGVAQSIYKNFLLPIFSPDDVKIKIGETNSWRLWNNIPTEISDFFYRIFSYGSSQAREMLLYAERGYINSHFSNYDPAKQDMWAEENRPWDYDHIIPRDWIIKQGLQGIYKDYCKDWINSIGNIAAISFESNRSKSNKDDFEEYTNNTKDLLFIEDLKNITSELRYNKKQSVLFANTIYTRFCNIYKNIYELMESILSKIELSETLQKRKNIMIEIQAKILETLPDSNTSNTKVYFATSDKNDHILEREQDWTREWIGVGITKGDFMVCFEWNASIEEDGSPRNAEIGIRKAIGTSVNKDKIRCLEDIEIEVVLNDWWYKCDKWENLSPLEISEKIKTIYKDIKD